MGISKKWLATGTAIVIAATMTTAMAQRVPDEFTIGGSALTFTLPNGTELSAAAALNDYLSINSATARRLSNTCFDVIERETGANSATIVILNPYGLVVDQHSKDGQRYTSIKITEHKAHTALNYRRPTITVTNVLDEDPWQVFRYHQIGLDGSQSGGVPIIVNDQLIGAMGIGGIPGVGLGYHDLAMMCLEEVFGPQG